MSGARGEVAASVFARGARRPSLSQGHLYTEAGSRVAARYLRSVRDRLERLRDMPRSGVAIPEYGAGVRFVPCRRHLIYYELEGRVVVVLRILHSAQDRDAIMGKKAE